MKLLSESGTTPVVEIGSRAILPRPLSSTSSTLSLELADEGMASATILSAPTGEGSGTGAVAAAAVLSAVETKRYVRSPVICLFSCITPDEVAGGAPVAGPPGVDVSFLPLSG